MIHVSVHIINKVYLLLNIIIVYISFLGSHTASYNISCLVHVGHIKLLSFARQTKVFFFFFFFIIIRDFSKLLFISIIILSFILAFFLSFERSILFFIMISGNLCLPKICI